MNNKVALITGVTGQDGSYLAELLLAKGYEVHGLKRRSSAFNTQRIDHIYVDSHHGPAKFKLHFGDMTDATNLIRLVAEVRPTEIYNLAAQSHVQVSFETPEYTANADALGTTRLLEAIRILDMGDSTRFYQASTSEMFGLAEEGASLNENSPFHPRSPYGVAKLYSHWITINYREAYGFFTSSGILFNHESPRRGETFVTQKIVRAAIDIRQGKLPCLYLGNLDSKRDWGHAKDYVEGMWKMLQMKEPDDYVLSTGTAVSVREFCEKVFRKLDIEITWSGSGLSEVGRNQNGAEIIRIDPRYFRPSEVPFLLGDSSKARAELDWCPIYTLDTLIDEMIEFRLNALQHLG